MKKLIIENETELLCLQEILKDLPYHMGQNNAKLSAISNEFRRNTLVKIEKIINSKPSHNSRKIQSAMEIANGR